MKNGSKLTPEAQREVEVQDWMRAIVESGYGLHARVAERHDSRALEHVREAHARLLRLMDASGVTPS
jgi:hypothetical protein